MYNMEVTKRNGVREQVQFDKISNRLRILCNLFSFNSIDPILIAQKTIENLYNGITTQELDELSARVCATLSSTNPKYNDFGGVICVSNLQKSTPNTFFGSMKLFPYARVFARFVKLAGESHFQISGCRAGISNFALSKNICATCGS